MFGNKSVWGWLYPYQGSKKCRALKGRSYVVGKDSGCDVVIYKQQIPSRDDYANLNKQHFKIKRKDDEVFLKDLSSMHTYVNGKELYLNEKVKLKHNDVISVLRHNLKVFVFLDSQTLQAGEYPEFIKNKYVVSYSLRGRESGITHVVFHKETCERLVLKKLGKCQDKAAEKIENLAKLQHPCLMPITDVHVVGEEIYIVQKHAEGDNLLSRIHPKRTLTDEDIKLVFFQLALAVQFLHQNNIAHGNLKPENILLLTPDSKSLIKVTDISLSATTTHASESENADSPLYMAPELVGLRDESRASSTQADIWALGVILFYCLSGSPPFKLSGRSSSEWTCSFLPSVWSRRSLAKHLVKAMLAPSPSERILVSHVLTHPWLKSDAIMSLAHSVMYPGEKYERPEEQTPPSSPKEQFFEDVIVQKPKYSRHLSEKFGVQVLPLGPVSRKSMPENVLMRSENYEDSENHALQKSLSFKQPGNADSSCFRKSWSQRSPGFKPVPPVKPPRKSLGNGPQTPTLAAPCERRDVTPPVPPPKPLRLFKQVAALDCPQQEGTVPQDNSTGGKNEMSNDHTASPPKYGNQSCEDAVTAVDRGMSTNPVGIRTLDLPQTSGASDKFDRSDESCLPPPIPSPRNKVPQKQEHPESSCRNSYYSEEKNFTNFQMQGKYRSNVANINPRHIILPKGLLAHDATARSQTGAAPTEVFTKPPQKPVRTSSLNHGSLSILDKPRKKKSAPHPPPKPSKPLNGP